MSSEAVAALSALFVELDDINKLLNDYEQTRNSRTLAQAAVKIKTGAPKLKAIISNPAYKTPDTAPLINDLKVGFKNAFSRAKSLKGGGGGGDDNEEEEESSSTPSKPTASKRNDSNSNNNTPVKANGKAEEDEDRRRKAEEAARRRAEEDKERQRKEEQRREERAAEEKRKEEEREKKRVEDEKRRAEEQKKIDEEEAKEREIRKKQIQEQKEIADRRRLQKERIMNDNEDGKDETSDTDSSFDKGNLRTRFKGKDIWSSILKDKEIKAQSEYDEGKFSDNNFSLIVVGTKVSGKTTLINRFLEKQGDPKASTALEYSYGKRIKNNSDDVVHCWELAGGTSLASLFDVCLTPENIHQAAVVITADLSDPPAVMNSVLKWLDTIRARTDACLAALSKSNAPLYDALKKVTNYPASHADKEAVKPIGVPVIIVGTKYDSFQDIEAERRKILTRALRCVANTHGVSLVFVTLDSTKEDGSYAKLRSLLNFYLFRTPLKNPVITEYTKPLSVPAGADTFESIGKAPGPSTKTGVAAWKAAFDQVFPVVDKDESSSSSTKFDETSFAKYPEPIIDSIRTEKEKELERYHREMARHRAREQSLQSNSPSQRRKQY